MTAVSGREAWRRLYTLAGEVRALAPWHMGTMPAAIHVRSERMLAMLQPFGGAGVALRRPRALPALDAARRSLVAHFAR